MRNESGLPGVVNPPGGFAETSGHLGGWRWLGWLPVLGMIWTVVHAPDWVEPYRLRVTLAPGQSVILGGEAWWAVQADRDHVLLHREIAGAWRLTHRSLDKQLLWQPAGESDYRPVRQWPLTVGARFSVGAEELTVLAADASRLVLHSDGRRWEYDGVRLRQAGQPLPECYPGWRSWLRNGLAGLGLNLGGHRPLRLGGGVYCADRLGIAGVAVDTATVRPTRTGFVLQAGAGRLSADSPVITATGTPQAESLERRSIPLTIGDRLIMGRSRYQVVETAPDLELAALTRVQRRRADAPPPVASPAVSVQWRSIAWLWSADRIGGLGWFGLTLLPLALGLIGPGRWQSAVALTLAGACLGAYLARADLPVLWPYLLAWPALALALATVRSAWNVRLLAVLILLIGSGWITLLQLGVGAGESGGLRYGGGNAALTGAFGWLAWAVWTFRQGRPAVDQRSLQGGVYGLGGVALLLSAGQIGLGDERGWAGLQPFELTKLALIATTAWVLRPGVSTGTGDSRRSVRLGGSGLLAMLAALVVISGFVLLFLRDFSPLVLLLLWGLAMGWAWLAIQPHPRLRRAGQVIWLTLVLALAVGLGWLQQHPEDFPLDFQAERIQVWAAPDRYPHAGYQLRRALDAIRAGGWWGTVWTAAANGSIMHLPAVENDFTPAFLLNRYGSLAGLALVGLQAALIGILIIIAGRTRDQGRFAADPPAILGGFAGLTLYGGAALLGAHFLVSWGTNLGFLPVMGQPMPLLSAAGSHLTLFVLPVIALAVAVEEQNHDDSR